MRREVYISETNCITPLGFDVASNISNILSGVSGIQLQVDQSLLKDPFYGAVINNDQLTDAFNLVGQPGDYTRMEQMLILALHPIVKKAGIELNNRTAFILSTTKGNITSLQKTGEAGLSQAHLQHLAKKVAAFFGFTTQPIVVSNACVSGILAVSVAKRLIQGGMYDHAFIVAGDEVSEFVLSGFSSFQAMSEQPCKPYSKNRNGVTLGEAAAAALATTDREHAKVKVVGDGSINDANHISGPSRTGEGLFLSISSALNEAGIGADQIDYISAHGTATPFNDEMEAIALNRLNLQQAPINSLKGFYGHTLGASGLLETVIGLESVTQSTLFASIGFDEMGVSQPINVIEKTTPKNIRYFLKTASGFGGCNTAVLFEKVN